MTNENKDLRQRISLLLDAELDGRDNPVLLDKLERDEELKATWQRYHLIGQVMRSPGGMLADADFAARVSALIQDEPTVMAPRWNALRAESTTRRKVVTFALAASLASVAVLIGKSLTDNAGDFYALSAKPQAVASIDSNSVESGKKMADEQFNDYLLMHNETAYMAGSAGMMPYVRLVSAGPDR